ncbi:hypothetical protein bcgnr5378_36780 [Bacillus cereus]|nr:hypothetical protein [Bacillus cereus]HDR8320385.1 hypothetical protein [Bacillus cereus]HDR8331330.1 hypothetical protein [Bacillus cereus]HDR8334247.1 hypothetical protein [Bacillus cereus]
MNEKKFEFQSHEKYKLEISYRDIVNTSFINSEELGSMEEVRRNIEKFMSQKFLIGFTLEEIKVSVVIRWEEISGKSKKLTRISDFDKDIANLSDIKLHYKGAEKRLETEREIRNRIIDDSGDFMDMDYVKKIGHAFDD